MLIDNLGNGSQHDPKIEVQMVEALLNNYPKLKLGERMLYPVVSVTDDGVIITDPNVVGIHIEAQSFQFILPVGATRTIDGLEHAKYIHPYQVLPLGEDNYLFRVGASGFPLPSKEIAVERQTLEDIRRKVYDSYRKLYAYLTDDKTRFTHREYEYLKSAYVSLEDTEQTIEDLLKIGSYSLIQGRKVKGFL